MLITIIAMGCDGSNNVDTDDASVDGAIDGAIDMTDASRECVPDTKRCTGLVPETCDATGTWVSGTACDYVCAAGDCAGECVPDAKRCTDLVPESCDATGTWIAGAACEFVCAAGECSGACTPGTLRCTDTQPEVCNEAGLFENAGEACEFVCTAGVCEGSCVPETTRCEGLSPQQCDAMGTYQPLGEACPFVCADAACTGTCVPGTTRCASGGAIETCDATGNFVFSETCVQACSAGACACGPDYVGDGYDCQPLDFCAPTRGGCAPNATCTQSGVVPSCACNVGSIGDGLACSTPAGVTLVQSFEDINTLTAAGWIMQNSSVAVGSTGWLQGNPVMSGGPFDAYNGPVSAFLAANYNNTGNTGTISNWLLTPEIDFGDEAALAFYTRKAAPDSYSDRLEVRVCTALPCAAPGSHPDVGAYSTLLLSINPDEVLGVYPTSWTRFEVTNASGLPRHGRGRIAFRYHVTNGGILGARSDYIGIDQVSYQVGAPSYPISGTFDFVGAAANVTLSLNRQIDLPITSSGAFTFPSTLSMGTPYAITVQGVPSGTTCVVTNGTGSVAAAPITDVSVTCTTP